MERRLAMPVAFVREACERAASRPSVTLVYFAYSLVERLLHANSISG